MRRRTGSGSTPRAFSDSWRNGNSPVPRSRRSWTDLVLAAIAVGIGIAAESRSYAWGDARHWLPDLLTGWTLIACGAVARGRTGLLLEASGVAWFAGNFTSAV